MRNLAPFALLIGLTNSLAQPTATQVAPIQACPNLREELISAEFPRRAMRLSLENGEAVVEFTVDMDNKIKNPVVLQSTHDAFAEHALKLVGRLKCHSHGQEVKVVLPLSFRVG